MPRDSDSGDGVTALGSLATFPEVFAWRAAVKPHGTALHTVRMASREPAATTHSCARVWQDTLGLANQLVTLSVQKGDRVLLSLQEPELFLAALLATQCLGAIAVPVPSLAELPSRAYDERVAAIAADAQPSAIVTGDEHARSRLSQLLTGAAVLNASAELDTQTVQPRHFEPKRTLQEVAFLQYTSGSTGAPKGVVVSHGNLLANLHAMIDGGQMDARDVIYSWLPLFHDMGLVAGLMLGVYLGIPTFVAPPKTFITRPESWLRAIHRFRATFSAAPNFAFHTLARKVPDRALTGLDLSAWRLAFAGAELVEPATVEAFVARYARYGFQPSSLRPAYGLAECTLAVSFPRRADPPRFDRIDRTAMTRDGVAIPSNAAEASSAVFTSVGPPLPRHGVRIRDVATGAELAEGQIGEICVTGPSVTAGYFDELRAGATPRSELRTGDLGYLRDGEIFIVDRIKDLLVVAGRKYLPGDIERVVAAIEGLRAGSVVVCSLRGSDGTERAYVVAALEAGAFSKRSELGRRVVTRVRDHTGLGLSDVFFVRPGQIPRTSSGKLQRRACAALIESGEITSTASRASRPASEVRDAAAAAPARSPTQSRTIRSG